MERVWIGGGSRCLRSGSRCLRGGSRCLSGGSRCLRGGSRCYIDYSYDIIQPNTTKYTQRPLDKFNLQTKVLINCLSSPQLKAFSIHAPLTWNKLPSSLRSISSTSLFKTKLKTFLFSLQH